MLHLCVVLAFLFGATAHAAGDGDGAEAAAVKPIHFKIETASSGEKTILGRLDASEEGGATYDRAVLDLDGDGTPEETIPLKVSGRTDGTERFDVDLRWEMQDKKWRLDLRGSTTDPFKKPVYMFWSLAGPGGSVFFINGKVPVYPTAEEALKGKAVRLGPPFHFEVSSSTRGPDALVYVGLKDVNGSTLRSASRSNPESEGRQDARISLAFVRDGKEEAPIGAQYG
jgi:hypothetical protein